MIGIESKPSSLERGRTILNGSSKGSNFDLSAFPKIQPLRNFSSGSKERKDGLLSSPQEIMAAHHFGTADSRVRFDNNYLSPHEPSLRSSYQKRLDFVTAKDEGYLKRLFHTFKEEHRGFIESEIKMSLMDIKNNLFEQQFGFERQICNLINQLTQEVLSQQKQTSEVINETQVKAQIDHESQRIQKVVLDDIGSLQKWIDTLLEGIDTLKRSHEDHSLSMADELKGVQIDLAKIKNEERALESLEEQVQDLHKLITTSEALVPSNNDDLKRIQQTSQSNKASIGNLQEQFDQLHRMIVDKADKESSDSNFLVLQNEHDNLKMKLMFHESKTQQLEEVIQSTIKQAVDGLNETLFQVKDQSNTDLLLVSSQLQGIIEFITHKFQDIDDTINSHSQHLDILSSKQTNVQDLSLINEMNEHFCQKIDELSQQCQQNQLNSEKIDSLSSLIEQDVKKRITEALTHIGSLKGEMQTIKPDILRSNQDQLKKLKAEVEMSFQGHSHDQQELKQRHIQSLQQFEEFKKTIETKFSQTAVVNSKKLADLKEAQRVLSQDIKSLQQKDIVRPEVEIRLQEIQESFDSQVGTLRLKSLHIEDKTCKILDGLNEVRKINSLVQQQIDELSNKVVSQLSIQESFKMILQEQVERIQEDQEGEIRNLVDIAIQPLANQLKSNQKSLSDLTYLQQTREETLSLQLSRHQQAIAEISTGQSMIDQSKDQLDVQKNLELQLAELKMDYRMKLEKHITEVNTKLQEKNKYLSINEFETRMKDMKAWVESSSKERDTIVQLKLSEQESAINNTDTTLDSVQQQLNNYMDEIDSTVKEIQTNLIGNEQKNQSEHDQLSQKLVEIVRKDQVESAVVHQFIDQSNLRLTKIDAAMEEHKLAQFHSQTVDESIEHEIEAMNEEIDSLKKQIKALQEHQDDMNATSKDNSSLADVKPDLGELEERISMKHTTLAAKFNDLHENVCELLQSKAPKNDSNHQIELMKQSIEQKLLQEIELSKHSNELLRQEVMLTTESHASASLQERDMINEKMLLLEKRIENETGKIVDDFKISLAQSKLETIDFTKHQIDVHNSEIMRQINEMLASSCVIQSEKLALQMDENSTSFFDRIVKCEEKNLAKNEKLQLELQEEIKNSCDEVLQSLKSEIKEKADIQTVLELHTEIEELKNSINPISSKKNEEVQEQIEERSIANVHISQLDQSAIHLNQSKQSLIDFELIQQRITILESSIKDILPQLVIQDQTCTQKQNAHDIALQKIALKLESSKDETSTEFENLKIALSELKESNGSIDVQIKLILKQIEDNAKQQLKSNTQFSLKDREAEVEIEKMRMVTGEQSELIKTFEGKLEDFIKQQGDLQKSQEAQISQSTEGFVESMEKVEQELDRKIGKLRTILDETKVVKHETQGKVIGLEESIRNMQQRLLTSEYEIEQLKVDNQMVVIKQRIEVIEEMLLKQSSSNEPANLQNLDSIHEQLNALSLTMNQNHEEQNGKIASNYESQQQDYEALKSSLTKVEQEGNQAHKKLKAFVRIVGKLARGIALLNQKQQNTQDSLVSQGAKMNEIELKSHLYAKKIEVQATRTTESEKSAQNYTDEVSQTLRNEINDNQNKILNSIDIMNQRLESEGTEINQIIEEISLKVNARDLVGQTLADRLQKYEVTETLQNDTLLRLDEKIEFHSEETMKQFSDILDRITSYNQTLLKIEELEGHNGMIIQDLQEIKEQVNEMNLEIQQLDSEGKQRDLENKVRIEQIDEDMRGFTQNIVQDMEYMEQKVIEALQKDTIAIIEQEELQPIKNRLSQIENSSLSPSRQLGLIPEEDSQNTPGSATKRWHQEHQKLLDDMRRRRMFYLRKTPMDARLEEIMRVNDISQSEALKVYSDELEKNRAPVYNQGIRLQNQSISPLRRRDLNEELSRPSSIFQSLYQGIVEQISPSRQEQPLTNQAPQNTITNQHLDLPWQKNLSNSNNGPSELPYNRYNLPQLEEEKSPNQLNHEGRNQRRNGQDDANIDIEDLDGERDNMQEYIKENMVRMSAISPQKAIPKQDLRYQYDSLNQREQPQQYNSAQQPIPNDQLRKSLKPVNDGKVMPKLDFNKNKNSGNFELDDGI